MNVSRLFVPAVGSVGAMRADWLVVLSTGGRFAYACFCFCVSKKAPAACSMSRL
ncbi:MAG: hypothetical protein IKF72_08190 [Kiritimatiellae bacterium]|nr:hypothetical protein [Kiritimatiellia bacterium]